MRLRWMTRCSAWPSAGTARCWDQVFYFSCKSIISWDYDGWRHDLSCLQQGQRDAGIRYFSPAKGLSHEIEMDDASRPYLAFSRDSELLGSCTLPPGTFFKGTTGISWDIEAEAVLCLAFSRCFGSGFVSGPGFWVNTVRTWIQIEVYDEQKFRNFTVFWRKKLNSFDLKMQQFYSWALWKVLFLSHRRAFIPPSLQKNDLHFKTWNFLNFLLFMGRLLTSWIQFRIPSPDPRSRWNPDPVDPDPKYCLFNIVKCMVHKQ